jgi:hypothetical protein
MARNRIDDIGAEALRRAGVDPVGSFMLRILGPGVRRELSRLEDRVSNIVGGISDTFREFEGDENPSPRRTKVKVEVVDAEFVDERSKR